MGYKQYSVVIGFLLVSMQTLAHVSLPSILGNHMVLQQQSEVSFWGWCNPGEKIRIMVDWDSKIYETTGTDRATWSVKVKTPVAGGAYKVIINGSNAIVLEDVLIGEVWVCGGQSNMEWSGDQGLQQVIDEAPKATNKKIRFFYIPKSTSENPQDNCGGAWKVCNPEDMKQFSAIGYFFGKKLQKELNSPIGLINSNWGGTPAEVWTPAEVIKSNPTLQEAAAKIEATPWWPTTPGLSYNAMIYPITNFSIAGAIWYQGESNTNTYASYEQLFTTMIGEWRKAWKKDFPFYYVQIAPFVYENSNVGALLREAQTKSMSCPNTGMVVVSDLVDDVKNIHPINKIDVGQRLANWALADTYNKKGEAYKSPLYKEMKIENNHVKVSFYNAESGLISKNGEPKGFYIAGSDRIFYMASAKIEGNSVLLYSKEVKTPVAVRFGFSNEAISNVYSKDGLPANLFRTDNWEMETNKK